MSSEILCILKKFETLMTLDIAGLIFNILCPMFILFCSFISGFAHGLNSLTPWPLGLAVLHSAFLLATLG
jgi:hypothetical protein